MSKYLILGGAGYIGSTQVWALKDLGHEVHVYDDLSAGHKQLLPKDVPLTVGRVGNRSILDPLLNKERFDCVMHFAAKALVAESVSHPELYDEYNVRDSHALLDAMVATGTKNLVFSSTCAVFGEAQSDQISESHPKKPVNHYGVTKLEVEKLIAQYCADSKISSVVLRYFNASGAESKLRTGEWHDIETHLIPNLIRAALSNKALSVYGRDYNTPDGTCVRDYIHVSDLAAYHIWASEKLIHAPKGFMADFNLGSGIGYSILDIAKSWEQLSGRKLPLSFEARRPGDPPRLVADTSKIVATSGIRPQHKLDSILKSAWGWEKELATKN